MNTGYSRTPISRTRVPVPVVDLPLPRLHVHVEVGQVVVEVHGTRTKVPVHSTSFTAHRTVKKKLKNLEKY